MEDSQIKKDAEAAALWAKEHGVTRIDGGKWIRDGKVVKETREPDTEAETSPWGWGSRPRAWK